ncbi:MAG: response regulator [Thalassotalea sp.]
MRILVVDDMISIRHVVIHMLRDLGYDKVDEACEGEQALTMLNNKPYDLVITDYYMPNMDGQQLLEAIRAKERFINLPVLIISCVDDKAKIKALIKYNISGFIVKPFSTNTLKKQLNRIKQALPTENEYVLG